MQLATFFHSHRKSMMSYPLWLIVLWAWPGFVCWQNGKQRPLCPLWIVLACNSPIAGYFGYVKSIGHSVSEAHTHALCSLMVFVLVVIEVFRWTQLRKCNWDPTWPLEPKTWQKTGWARLLFGTGGGYGRACERRYRKLQQSQSPSRNSMGTSCRQP